MKFSSKHKQKVVFENMLIAFFVAALRFIFLVLITAKPWGKSSERTEAIFLISFFHTIPLLFLWKANVSIFYQPIGFSKHWTFGGKIS